MQTSNYTYINNKYALLLQKKQLLKVMLMHSLAGKTRKTKKAFFHHCNDKAPQKLHG